MFYFSHPFGIASPPCNQQNPQKNEPTINYCATSCKSNHTNNNMDNKKKKSPTNCSNRKSSYIPWPMSTWQRDYILPSLVQILAKQMGELYV